MKKRFQFKLFISFLCLSFFLMVYGLPGVVGRGDVYADSKVEKQYTLKVQIAPPGGGSVTKSPDKPLYAHGDEVQLTETENPGYCFSQWTGGASGSSNPVTITIDRNTTVTAHFKKKKCKKGPDDCDD